MAMLKSSFTLILLRFTLFPCFALSIGVYQYFQLVQQWPPNFCFNRQKHPCFKNPTEILTIHGLWPSNFSQVNYKHQCRGNSYNPQMLRNRTMLNQLSKSWPELIFGNNHQFWSDEWDKHGKCSDQTYDQMQYFQRSYDIWGQFNITPILQSAGIRSGQKNPTPCNVANIETRIKAITHATPGLRCRLVNFPIPGQQSKRYVRLLYEVALCYDYSGKNLIGCTNTQSKCTGNNIYF